MSCEIKKEITKEECEKVKRYIDIMFLNQNQNVPFIEIVRRGCFKILGDLVHLEIIQEINKL